MLGVGRTPESATTTPSLVWIFLLLLLLASLHGNRGQVSEEFSVGRTFVLNPKPLSWEAALEVCRELNGTLARLMAESTLPDLRFSPNWTMWVGARVTEGGAWRWEDGTEVNYSNWREVVRSPVPGECASVSTASVRFWEPSPCTEPLPSLCMIRTGTCRFVRQDNAAILAHNNAWFNDLDDKGCEQECLGATSFLCRSYEYNFKWGKLCHLSEFNRWLLPNRYVSIDPEWTYFHRTCNTGVMYHDWLYPPTSSSSVALSSSAEMITPSPSLEFSSSTEFSSTEFSSCSVMTTTSLQVLESTVTQTVISTSVLTTTMTATATMTATMMITTTATMTTTVTMTPVPSPTTPSPPGRTVVCQEVKIPEVGTTPVPEEVRELQELNIEIKQRVKVNSKISKPDPRSSATYVGTIFVSILLSILGGIVLLDLISLPQRFRNTGRTGDVPWKGKSSDGRKFRLRRIGQQRSKPAKSKCQSSRSRLAELGVQEDGETGFTEENTETRPGVVCVKRIIFETHETDDSDDDADEGICNSGEAGGGSVFEGEADQQVPVEISIDIDSVGVSPSDVAMLDSSDAQCPHGGEPATADLDERDIALMLVRARVHRLRDATDVESGAGHAIIEDTNSFSPPPGSGQETNYYFCPREVETQVLDQSDEMSSGNVAKRGLALPSIYNREDSSSNIVSSTFL